MKGGRTSEEGPGMSDLDQPQWSPPMKGGRTCAAPVEGTDVGAAMEPAYERRENLLAAGRPSASRSTVLAAMGARL